MFGYITPLVSELRVREYNEYKSVYCGLCKELGRRYGLAARMLLNYDLVLIALVADGLSGEAPNCGAERCIASPLAKRPVCGSSNGLALAADALVLLGWYKLLDDLADSGPLRRIPARLALLLLHGAYKKAALQRPQLDDSFCRNMQAQQALEAAGCALPDQAADPSAQMLGTLMAACSPEPRCRRILYRYGMFLGRVIYYLDAAEDFQKDAQHKRYNVFLQASLNREQMLSRARALCNMCAGEAITSYRLLPLRRNEPLLENVLCLGLAERIRQIGEPRKRKRSIKA